MSGFRQIEDSKFFNWASSIDKVSKKFCRCSYRQIFCSKADLLSNAFAINYPNFSAIIGKIAVLKRTINVNMPI